ncbi:HesB/YadR/YfhF family protein [Effusibacillus consociatus]|uniref:HesB/YadR/YfhF family protein n=1 Tax=Effusibacillus consociatus TaxID=1117041 RepID=A0ABV9PV07_9BACL
MHISVTQPAVEWFKKEMDAKEGDSLRFFARLGGCSTVQSGFSLGVTKELPRTVGIHKVVEGITFFMEQEDVWYLNGQNLLVDCDEKLNELKFLVNQE